MKLRRILKLGSLSLLVLLIGLILAEHSLIIHFRDPVYQSKQQYVSACDNSLAYMTILQRIVATSQAYLGDGEAAWKLRNYYTYFAGSGCQGKRETASYWGEMAAENGYILAQTTLVSDIEKNFTLGRADKIPWMEKAAAKGWQGASEAIVRMRKMEADWKSRPSLAFSLLEASAKGGNPDAQYKVVVEAEAMFAAGRDDMLEWMEKAEKDGWKGADDALKRMRRPQ